MASPSEPAYAFAAELLNQRLANDPARLARFDGLQPPKQAVVLAKYVDLARMLDPGLRALTAWLDSRSTKDAFFACLVADRAEAVHMLRAAADRLDALATETPALVEATGRAVNAVFETLTCAWRDYLHASPGVENVPADIFAQLARPAPYTDTQLADYDQRLDALLALAADARLKDLRTCDVRSLKRKEPPV
jgi:hypothetical protein